MAPYIEKKVHIILPKKLAFYLILHIIYIDGLDMRNFFHKLLRVYWTFFRDLKIEKIIYSIIFSGLKIFFDKIKVFK